MADKWIPNLIRKKPFHSSLVSIWNFLFFHYLSVKLEILYTFEAWIKLQIRGRGKVKIFLPWGSKKWNHFSTVISYLINYIRIWFHWTLFTICSLHFKWYEHFVRKIMGYYPSYDLFWNCVTTSQIKIKVNLKKNTKIADMKRQKINKWMFVWHWNSIGMLRIQYF